MYRIKQFVKKVLIRLHIMKRPEVVDKRAKGVPDFVIGHRPYPTVLMKQGEIQEQLNNQENPQIALQVHAFFIDVMGEIVDILNSVPYPFDCYVSTDTEEKRQTITELLTRECQIHYLQVDVMDNRGRDVGPFLQQLGPVIDRYKYIAHLHTKKSKHTDFGDDWRHFLFRNLFDGPEIIGAILERFEQDEKLGLVVPEVYPIVRELLAWDNTKDDVQKLLKNMGLRAELGEIPMCPVGDFFWARTEAVKILFKQGFQQSDFQEEAGQLNYTLAHVIERIWCYMVEAQGYHYEVCINGMTNEMKADVDKKRVALYAVTGEISETDCDSLKKIEEAFERVIKITSEEETNIELWVRAMKENWSDIKEFDEVALIDSSGIGPFFDLRQIMNVMSKKNHEQWSLFKVNISKAIFSVISLVNMECEEILSFIQGDQILQEAYVRESAYIGEWLFAKEPISELAFDYIILHAPFVKKDGMRQNRKNESCLLQMFLEKQTEYK